MATATTFLKLIKAAVGEKYSLTTINKNLDDIDAGIIVLNKSGKGIQKSVGNEQKSTGLDGRGIMCDLLKVSLVKDRWYQIDYRFNTVTTVGNMALGVTCVKSAIDKVDNSGTLVEAPITLYTAPAAQSGKTHQVLYQWRATTTEEVNMKIVSTRLTTTAEYAIELRRMYFSDLGDNWRGN